MSSSPPHRTEAGSNAVRGAAALVRLGVIGAAVIVAVGGFAFAGGWLTPERLSPRQVTDALERTNGHHPGFRRNHAKGICIAGTFLSNGTGSILSRASVFKEGPVPVIGRLALAAGQPMVPDTSSPVWSMALRFFLADGEEWRTGMNNIPVFTVRNAQEFTGLVEASRPDPTTGKPDPAVVKAFLGEHPATAAAISLIQGAPKARRFTTASFNSLNAFRFIDDSGQSTAVRWSMISQQADETLADDQGSDPNYLFDDLLAAVRRHPLQWRLVVTIAAAGDVTSDPTVEWPVERHRVEVGTLTIDRVEGEATGGCRDVNFDPLVLPVGIEPSDDPILSARSAVYAESVRRRDGEAKEPSAVQAAAARPGDTE